MDRSRGAVALLAAGAGAVALMVAVVAVALGTRPAPATHRVRVRLPSLSQIVGVEKPCGTGVYPAGARYRYERCEGDAPVGWPACSTVTYSVDGRAAPAGYRADLAAAVAEAMQATGLRLVEVASHPNISIVWDPTLYDPKPGTSGEAGVTSFRSSGSHATSAAVRISSHLVAGSQSGMGELPILLHELGHALGLAHFDGPEVMNPLDRGFSSYQPGDLAGLTRLYHPATCA